MRGKLGEGKCRESHGQERRSMKSRGEDPRKKSGRCTALAAHTRKRHVPAKKLKQLYARRTQISTAIVLKRKTPTAPSETPHQIDSCARGASSCVH
jgi:hypothetical protein